MEVVFLFHVTDHSSTEQRATVCDRLTTGTTQPDLNQPITEGRAAEHVGVRSEPIPAKRTKIHSA